MKKTKLALGAKLLLQKDRIIELTGMQKDVVAGGGPPTKTCPNTCILTLCNIPDSTACPPTN